MSGARSLYEDDFVRWSDWDHLAEEIDEASTRLQLTDREVIGPWLPEQPR